MLMSKSVLFVLGGFIIGGVETYVTRLSKELSKNGCVLTIIILSNKYNSKLIEEISKYAKIIIFENFSFLSASSWLNAYIPFKDELIKYDLVHVVDHLTLGFIYLNQNVIKFDALSIGIYHSRELDWWEDKNIYFRRKLLELYRKNISLTLFPNENTAQIASRQTRVPMDDLDILPLGIELTKYASCNPSFDSKRIVSVGRLADFKVYNKHIISELNNIRKFGEYEYYIYGIGAELVNLQKLAKEHNVKEYVHFMGQVDYKELPNVLNNAFCFVGSGTVLIEASAAGIPSIVGIESIKTPHTCGFFSEIIGYSYNEMTATNIRIAINDVFKNLVALNLEQYLKLSEQHRTKAYEFDLQSTAIKFLDLSSKQPDFNISVNRWISISSFIFAILRFGSSSFKGRHNHS